MPKRDSVLAKSKIDWSLVTSAVTGEGGFCIRAGAARIVCGWLFLAWLSQARDVAGAPGGMVAA
jgi:hypothetical protein